MLTPEAFADHRSINEAIPTSPAMRNAQGRLRYRRAPEPPARPRVNRRGTWSLVVSGVTCEVRSRRRSLRRAVSL
jgi:hypothetical protein